MGGGQKERVCTSMEKKVRKKLAAGRKSVRKAEEEEKKER